MTHHKSFNAVGYFMLYSKPDPVTFLKHYGVKGMKWGVRRTQEELRYNGPSIVASVNRKAVNVKTATGSHVAEMSIHAGDQAQERNVLAKEIVDALQSPVYIRPVKTDKQGRRSQQFIGMYATAAVNPDTGIVTSVWKTSHRRIKTQ